MIKVYNKFFRKLFALIALTVLSTYFVPLHAQPGMMYPVSLQERVVKSGLIVEGKVTAKKSYFSEDGREIYTANKIEVYKVFKGNLPSNRITVLTQGGVVGDQMVVVHPSLKLNVGDAGIFTLQTASTPLNNFNPNFDTERRGLNSVANQDDYELFEPHASAQGFVKYDKGSRKAVGVFDQYRNVNDDLYHKIETLTGKPFVAVKGFDANDYMKPKNSGARATVTISSITPSTTSAGTYTEIVIAGSGFGTTPGTVRFPNADDGGASTITNPIDYPSNLINSWTDTEIRMYVPSGASTGNVEVRHATSGSDVSPITITHNVTNFEYSGNNIAYAADLISDNGAGGYTWTYNTNFYSNTEAVARFKEALCEWSNKTSINWDTAATQTSISCNDLNDGVNVCTFDGSCNLPNGVLGTCYSGYSACGSGGVYYWYVNDLDIKFDAGQNWYFGTGAPGGSQYDFLSVALHEVGHGHQQGHYPLTTDVMYWSLTNGATSRIVDANATAGGSFIMTRSSTNESGYTGSTGGSTSANPCGPPAMIASGCSVTENCYDGIQNQSGADAEDDIDCGGASCVACADLCTNGVQDPSEDGIDCGPWCTPCCTPPSNDTICGATTVTLCSSGVLSENNTCAGTDYSYGCVTGDNMLWYTVDLGGLAGGPYNGFDLTISNSSSGGDFEMLIIGHDCGSLSAFDGQCGAAGTYNFTGLPIDSVYYIGVGVEDADVGTFDLCLTPTANNCIAGGPANDGICDADSIPLGTCSNIDSNFCATADYYGSSCVSSNPSVWYKITMDAATQLDVYFDTNTFVSGAVEMMLLDGSCSSPRSIVQELCGNASTDTFSFENLDVDSIYFLQISTDQGNEGYFRFCTEGSIPFCDTAGSPVNDSICNATLLSFGGGDVVCATGQTNHCSTVDYAGFGCIPETDGISPYSVGSVWYEFDLSAGYTEIALSFSNTTTVNDSIKVALWQADTSCESLEGYIGTWCIDATVDTISQLGLDSNKVYFIEVTTNEGDEGNFDICLEQVLDPCAGSGPPVNDTVCMATTITTDSSCLTGQTNYCSNNLSFEGFGSVPQGCFSAGTNVVWYKFNKSAGVSDAINIYISNHNLPGNVRAGLYRFDGDSCTASSVFLDGSACKDPDNGPLTILGLTDDTSTYYLGIGTADGEEGNFDICLEEFTADSTLTDPAQDCAGAKPICTDSYTETDFFLGYGNLESSATQNSCLNENNSIWYTFTTQTDGNLGFWIDSTTDAYRFVLWDITDDGCNGILDADEVNTSPTIRCNSYNGPGVPVGMDVATSNTNINETESAAPGMNGYTVTSGRTYVLLVDNPGAATGGYTLNFTGGGSIVDTTAPRLWSATVECQSNNIYIETDEPINCATIESGDFILKNMDNGFTYIPDTVYGVGCTDDANSSTTTIVVQHDGTIPSGTYRIIIDANPVLTDMCGNTATAGDYVSFNYIGRLIATADKASICTAGEAVQITVTGLPAGEVYTLNPGNQLNTSGVFTVYPTATTTYIITSTFEALNQDCKIQTSITIRLVGNVNTSVSPQTVTICSGSTDLIAYTTLAGFDCQTCTHSWSPGGSTGTLGAYDTINVTPGTYRVQATTPEGCVGNIATANVNLATVGSGNVCEVMYVAAPADGGSGSNDGLTKDAPTILDSALARALCTNTVIKCAVGTYDYDKYLWVNGFVTIEGGYDITFTTKSSDLSSGNGTIFVRDDATADDGTATGTEYSMFKVVGGSESFRFQDIKILMPGATDSPHPQHATSSAKSNYGINIGAGCTNYNVVRCVIDAGIGADL